MAAVIACSAVIMLVPGANPPVAGVLLADSPQAALASPKAEAVNRPG
jgi:hypothetical protein